MVKTTFINSQENTTLKNIKITGEWSKKVGNNGNANIVIKPAETVVIDGVLFDQTGDPYNMIEIGDWSDYEANNKIKSITISNVTTTTPLSNNAFSITGCADDTVIIIKDCKFGKVSNPLRFSNVTNAKNVTIKFKNCEFTEWETSSPEYAGAVLLQDYIKDSAKAVDARNLFGPEKLTIIFDNVFGPNGKISCLDASEICCSDNQVVYAYSNIKGIHPYSTETYPNIITK